MGTNAWPSQGTIYLLAGKFRQREVAVAYLRISVCVVLQPPLLDDHGGRLFVLHRLKQPLDGNVLRLGPAAQTQRDVRKHLP